MDKFVYDGRHIMIDAISSKPEKLQKPSVAIDFLEKTTEASQS